MWFTVTREGLPLRMRRYVFSLKAAMGDKTQRRKAAEIAEDEDFASSESGDAHSSKG